jgi:biopolymer transport protein ExbD
MMIDNALNSLADHDDDVDLINLADPFVALSAMLMLLMVPFSVVAANLANLPGQPAADQQQAPIAISFNAQGELFWNREPISREELSDRLAALKQAGSPLTIYLAGDKDCRYEVSLQVKAALADLGLEVQELVRSSQE